MEEKEKVVSKVTAYFNPPKRGDKKIDVYKTEVEYVEMTPEIKEFQEKQIDWFARLLVEDIKKLARNGIDISILDTPEEKQKLDDYNNRLEEEKRKRTELRKKKKNISDEEYEEFLKWKEQNKK